MNFFDVRRNFGYFCSHYKAILGVISIHFMTFPKAQGINWEYVFGSLKFQISFGVYLIIL